MSQRVVVIGGGLAGITAAIALAEAGAAVTLLEARPRLGGATCSFTRDGLVVDTGQHVFLGCCTAYRGLLARLGMTAQRPGAGPFRRDRARPGRPHRQAPPDRAARPPAYAARAGPLSLSFLGRTGVGFPPRPRDAPRGPGRSGGGYAAVR